MIVPGEEIDLQIFSSGAAFSMMERCMHPESSI